MALLASLVIVLVGVGAYTAYNLVTTTGDQFEGGTRLSPDETLNATVNGVQITMSYNATSDSFQGVVYNPTSETLLGVRVEIHMYNGSTSMELGPTPAQDLAPGESRTIELSADGWGFDSWVAHPEVSGGEGSGEDHGSEGGGGG